MGVCIELRSVMHWQQSARFSGSSRECSPLLNTFSGIGSSSGNNNQPCEQPCDHSAKSHGLSPSFNESCSRRYRSSEGIYEDSIQYSENNIENKEDIKSTYIQLKSEPPVSSSPELDQTCNLEDCAGCGKPIQDRFYLSAIEKRWHEDCLKCCVCSQALERASSCFSKEGNIYCKSDYCRIFGTRRCSKCLATISSSELVMRARNLVFHVKCFSCAICHLPFAKGDHYGIKDATVLCRLHFETAMDQASLSFSCQYPTQFGSPSNVPSSPKESNIKLTPVPYFSQHDLQVFPQQPRQKGRPRKRKPKDIEAMTANLDLNTDYLDMGFGRGSLSAAARAKRMRTSFKHHQLRTMKSYFAINHNPDAKDLKQLSQKTGLPKRVLQVWFQNARAKWRRMIMKQEGKSIECDKGESSLDLDSYGPPSPSFMCGPDSPSMLD